MHRTHAPRYAGAVLLLLAFDGASLAQDASKTLPAEEVKDPKALEVYDRMLTYLRSLPAFQVTANITQDDVVADNFKVQRNLQADVTVKRANRMRARLSGGEGDREFVYDGKTMTVYTEDKNYYATMPAPDTLLAALDAALDKHGIELPLLDIIYVALGGDLQAKIERAGYIGTETIAGRECEQAAFRGKRVDFQIWVAIGDKPVPCKLVLTTRDQPTFPQYSSEMRWNDAPRLDTTTFQFVKPEGALPITLAPAAPEANPKTNSQPK